MPHPKNTARLKAVAAATAIIATAAALTGCSTSGSSGDKVTITLSGPNQWTSDTSTFGKAWETLVAKFEKDNPDITLKTNVLPISSFSTTLATQLTAGTAPELIFNQTAHKPDQVVNLSPYLAKPNPFDSTSATWLDAFDSKFYGSGQKNASGNFEWVPFNLVSVGIYYNSDLLSKAGVDPASLTTFDGFTQACTALKAKGINPLATDNGALPTAWSQLAIKSMLLDQQSESINAYDASGNAGTADPVTAKSYAKAILTGAIDVSSDPASAEVAKVTKTFFDACATPNWSGIPAQGSFTGGIAFTGGKAAMAWGTNFSSTGLDDAGFKWSTIPFPTLSTSDSSFASGKPAQFGTAAGGTSYMIPAYIKGKQLAAAVKFLQYVSSPKVTDWLAATGGIPAVKGAPAPATMAALTSSDWSSTPTSANGPFESPAAAAGQNPIVGYLIGSKTLDQYLKTAQTDNITWAKEQVTANKWTDDWATK